MIADEPPTTVRRAEERRCERHRGRVVWHTFFPEHGAIAQGFGALEGLDEDRRPPGGGAARHRHRDAEVLTYVRTGRLTHDDSTGLTGVLAAGEFMRRTTDRGVRHGETNASTIHEVHLFQLWIRCAETSLPPSQEQKRFSAGDRRGGLCLVASPLGKSGSVQLHQDASVYSALLDAGQHVAHELEPGRRAWVHVVEGAVTMGELVLGSGDGAGVVLDRAVSITAREPSEILLIELGPDGASITMTG